MLLEVKELETHFHIKGKVAKAVDGVSFSVGRKEVVALVGESGSGKSVTSLSVLGLIPSPPGKIEGGEIIFDGEDLLKKSNKEMQDVRGNEISMIFQEPMTSLNPVYPVGKQITEAIRRHNKISKKEARAIAIEMLSKVGLPSPEIRVDDYPHQMSGGMRQRVMIAMALATKPQLLIADEPTTALDVTIQAQILDLMNRLREETGTSILLITHDLGVVAETADRVVVLYCGKVMEMANVVDLFEDPRHPYTQGLIASIPKMEGESGRLTMIEGNVPNPMQMPAGCPFEPRCTQSMEICKRKMPEIQQFGDRQVRCFLYEGKGEVE
ncbi:ABC transporter ATP-binding protein [Gottschalkiaceae bacterium SANA]|nr:ABC transporter ATP-binding protein [Gottschalkiaceae bacterium SANA]